MSILVFTIRFATLQLHECALKIRRMAIAFGNVALALFVFLAPAMQGGKWSGVALAQSLQAHNKENPVVIKVGNQVLTESDYNEWILDLTSAPPPHITAMERRDDAMAVAVLFALAEQGEKDHLNISELLNEAMKRKRIELLAWIELLKLQQTSGKSRKQILADLNLKTPIWVNDDLLANREAGEEKLVEQLRASGYRVKAYGPQGDLEYSPDVLGRVKWYVTRPETPLTLSKDKEKSPCSILTAPGPLYFAEICPEKITPVLSPAEQQQSPEEVINSIRNGPHTAMPPAQTTGSIAGSGPSIAITNNTPYTLWVYFSGPTSQTVEIAAHGTQSVSLNSGSYQVGAKVSDPSVLPFYGEQGYGSGTQYIENFYIGTKP